MPNRKRRNRIREVPTRERQALDCHWYTQSRTEGRTEGRTGAMQYIRDTAKAYSDFLDQWDWQLHMTLTFRRPLHLQAAMKEARKYLNNLKRTQPKMKFSAVILGTKGHSRNHVHVLLLCDEKYPVTFKKIGIYPLLHHWTQGTATVSDNSQWDNETITDYLTKRRNLNLNNPDSYDLDFYRPQLLRQFRRTENEIHI